MTPEQRLDRLERITKLFIKAGQRARRELRQQDEKINMLIDAQIKSEDKFAVTEAEVATLAKSQADTNRRLAAIIDTIGEGHNQ